MIELVARDTWTAILDTDDTPRSATQRAPRRTLVDSCRDERDTPATWRKAHRIPKQIDENLAHTVDVTEIHDVVGRFGEMHGDITCGRLWRDER